MASDKQSWRLTGLWSKSLPSGGKMLSAKVPLQVLLDVLQEVKASGLHEVEVEVWESRYAEERKPTHNLRLVEPFKPRQSGPTWSNPAQDNPPYVSKEEVEQAADVYPF